MKTIAISATLLVICAIFIAVGGLHSWEYNVSVQDVLYERVRFEEIEGQGKISIGFVSDSAEINEMIFVGWLHRRADGSVLGGSLKEETTIGELSIPARTWVSFNLEGQLLSCHFPEEQTIQGHVCRGTGDGAKGPVVNFYPSGRLKFFFAPENCVIQDVDCAGGLFSGIGLHESGKLKSCTLSNSLTIDGTKYPSGTLLRLDEEGNPED